MSSETETPPAQGKPSRPARRRLVLALGAVAFAAGGFPYLVPAVSEAITYLEPLPVLPDLETEVARVAVERANDVLLVTYRDLYRVLEVPLPQDKGKQPARWEVAESELLGSFFPHWPEHFYKTDLPPKSSFLLAKNFGIRGNRMTVGGCCAFELTEDAVAINTAGISRSILNPRFPRMAFQTATHELVHKVTPGALSLERDGWVREIATILGVPDIWSLDKYLSSIKSSWAVWLKQGFGFTTSKENQIIYGFTNTLEFIAVLGEEYIGGRNYFGEGYSHFFKESVIKDLYQFTQNRIFRGQSYEEFPFKT